MSFYITKCPCEDTKQFLEPRPMTLGSMATLYISGLSNAEKVGVISKPTLLHFVQWYAMRNLIEIQRGCNVLARCGLYRAIHLSFWVFLSWLQSLRRRRIQNSRGVYEPGLWIDFKAESRHVEI